jgi:hypothetical protein
VASRDSPRIARIQKPSGESGQFQVFIRLKRGLPDVVGVFWVAGIGIATVLPALAHGPSLGPFDLLSSFGLSSQSGVRIHNAVSSDQIQQMLPWSTLTWNAVHHGQLPLWNRYSALGMPLAFNWQSAPFSATTAIGYLVPLRFAYTVAVIARLLVAGTGAYVFARVLRQRPLAAAFAGTVFVASGSFTVWAGYPLAAVVGWTGWILAAQTLVLRGHHRARYIALLAIAVALSIYEGDPEASLLLGMVIATAAAAQIAVQARQDRNFMHVVRSARDLLIAGTAALGLSAPLVLPGLEVALRSARSVGPSANTALPAKYLLNFAFSRFDGVPLAGNLYFDFGSANYYETAAFVGVIALALAFVAVATQWRRDGVRVVASIGAVFALLIYAPPVGALLARLPTLNAVLVSRGIPLLTFAIAVLAGFGCNAAIERVARRRAVNSLAVTFAVGAVLLVGVAVAVARGAANLPPGAAEVRARSFLWPVAGLVAGLLVTLTLIAGRRWLGEGRLERMRAYHLGAAALLVVEATFLVTSGAPLWSSSPQFFATTQAEGELQRLVGSSTVGLGSCQGAVGSLSDLGIVVNANAAYGIQEFATYDVMISKAYFESYAAATGGPAPVKLSGEFCPAITSVTLAREYGVAYVLEPPGVVGPAGTWRVGIVGSEGVYAVPMAARATLDPSTTGAEPTDGSAAGQSVPAVITDSGDWQLAIDPRIPSTLHLRLTDEPGWRATINGQDLPLQSWNQVMLQASVPAGAGSIVLTYWPRSFTVGLVLALLSSLGLASLPVIKLVRRRSRP